MCGVFGRGDDAIGNAHRAQIVQFELFELILLLKLDKQLSIAIRADGILCRAHGMAGLGNYSITACATEQN